MIIAHNNAPQQSNSLEYPPSNANAGAAFRRQLDIVLDRVRIEEAASHYGEFRLSGAGRLVGRCVSPEHEDKSPSLTIFAEDQRFKCFGCGAHGDVLDLVRLAEPDLEGVLEAMIVLSVRYGIDLPPRPPTWFRRQQRQHGVRERIENERIRHIQKLAFRLLWVPWLRRLPAEERDACIESSWRESHEIARQLYTTRRSS